MQYYPMQRIPHLLPIPTCRWIIWTHSMKINVAVHDATLHALHQLPCSTPCVLYMSDALIYVFWVVNLH